MGKVICERVIPFQSLPKELWLKFPDKDVYMAREAEILSELKESEGNDTVIIYLEKERAKKVLPANRNVSASNELVSVLTEKLGEKNVKVVEKTVEKIRKMN